MYSRFPFRLEQIDDVGLANKAVRLRLKVNGRDVMLYDVHPAAPGSFAGIHANRAQCRLLAEAAAAEALPTILAGDFNHTPNTWNRRAIVDAGFHSAADDTRATATATWPFNRLAAVLRPRFRIDDVLLSGDLVGLSFDTHAVPGSDHAAVRATVAFRTAAR